MSHGSLWEDGVVAKPVLPNNQALEYTQVRIVMNPEYGFRAKLVH